MRVHSHRLTNGLRVYLSPNPEEPRVACRVVVRAGAALDPPDATGTAHLLEHLLANKGSERLGALDRESEGPLLERIEQLFEELNSEPDRDDLVRSIDGLSLRAAPLAISNELKQAYQRVGARGLNAFTSHDRTAYVVDVPPEALPVWAALESDRFRHPVFRAFQTEVETVREEKRRGLDDPARSTREALARGLWPKHPYRRPILGEVEHLDAPRPRAIRQWFERWYTPSNMALVLAGDLDPEATMALIEEHFSAWPAAAQPAPDLPSASRPRGEQRLEVTHHGAPSVSIGWRTVARGHPDELPLAVADMVLCNGATGLLDELQHRMALRRAWSSPSFRLHGGALTVGGSAMDGQEIDAVEGLLLDAVQRLVQGRVDGGALAAIIQAWRSRELRGLENNAWRAGKLMEAFTFDEPWEQVRDRTDRLAAVGLPELVAAAGRWLTEDRVVVTRRTGLPELPAMRARSISPRAAVQGRNSIFFDEAIGKKARPPDRPPLRAGQDYEEEGGVIRVPNPYSDLAAFSVRLATGQGHDPMLGTAMAFWDHCGRGEEDLAAWEAWLYARAGAADVGVARWSAHLTVRGPARHVPELLKGLRGRLEQPSWTRDLHGRWLEDLLLRRTQSRTTKGTLEAALRAYAAYDRESPWLAEPTADALREEPPDELLRRAQDLLGLSGERMAVGLTEAPGWSGTGTPPPRPARRFHRADRDRLLLLHHEGAQVQLALQLPVDRYDTAMVPLYKVLGQLLGGSAGLVFQQVREARGLAYSAQAQLDRGTLPGDDNRLVARIGTRPDQVVNAATLVRGLLREQPLARFEEARRDAITQLRSSHTSFRRIPSSVLSWRLRGLEGDPRPGWVEGLERLERDRFEAWVLSWRDTPITSTVVGDLRSVSHADLATLGTVERLEIAAISTR